MPEFISKLQHKNYEKGEFSDEKTRTLEETLSLIKNFPWDQERGVDIQLTGPSVTIQDENGNYLKVALYFNGKFCLYYLDNDNHLYEYHTPDLDDADNVVSDFFDGQIALQKFEKHLFSIGNRSHFEDASFDFTISTSKFYLRLFLTCLLLGVLAFSTIMTVLLPSPIMFRILFVLLMLLIILLGSFSVYFLIKVYSKSKNMFLRISCGNNTFQFSNYDSITTYNKSDIVEINIYGNRNSKSSPILNIIEITFNNDTQIKFPGLLIDPFLLTLKFSDTKFNFIEKSSEIRKALWNY